MIPRHVFNQMEAVEPVEQDFCFMAAQLEPASDPGHRFRSNEAIGIGLGKVLAVCNRNPGGFAQQSVNHAGIPSVHGRGLGQPVEVGPIRKGLFVNHVLEQPQCLQVKAELNGLVALQTEALL